MRILRALLSALFGFAIGYASVKGFTGQLNTAIGLLPIIIWLGCVWLLLWISDK